MEGHFIGASEVKRYGQAGLHGGRAVRVGALAGRQEPLEGLANPVGPDMMGSVKEYPLN
jgi:hypothetical protein